MTPLRKCNHVSCRALIPFDTRYCDKHVHHRKPLDKVYNDRRRRNDPEYVRFYKSVEWKNARKLALMRDNYLCVHCMREGYYVPAELVDHIIETKENWDLRLDQENLQALCNPCHQRKTFGTMKAPLRVDRYPERPSGTVGGSTF